MNQSTKTVTVQADGEQSFEVAFPSSLGTWSRVACGAAAVRKWRMKILAQKVLERLRNKTAVPSLQAEIRTLSLRHGFGAPPEIYADEGGNAGSERVAGHHLAMMARLEGDALQRYIGIYILADRSLGSER